MRSIPLTGISHLSVPPNNPLIALLRSAPTYLTATWIPPTVFFF